MMSFQRFTVLVTLMLFASQGATAAPLPGSPGTPSAADNILKNIGLAGGTVWGIVTPSQLKDESIKAAGGIVPP